MKGHYIKTSIKLLISKRYINHNEEISGNPSSHQLVADGVDNDLLGMFIPSKCRAPIRHTHLPPILGLAHPLNTIASFRQNGQIIAINITCSTTHPDIQTAKLIACDTYRLPCRCIWPRVAYLCLV